MVLLFRDFYEKHYKVPMCSCIALVWLLFFAMVVIIPWVLAWRAGGFWIKERTYFEQPNVIYKGDLIIAVMDEDGVSQVYSTIKEINEMQNSWTAGVPTI